MLQIIRDRAQGIIVWAIILLICLAFALVGVNAYLSGGSQAVVAVVNGQDIPQSRFQKLYQQEQAFRKQLFANDPGSGMLDEDVVRRAAMDRLINSEVEYQAADDAGFRISNTLLNQQIRQMSQFQSDGAFDSQRYTTLLRNQGWTREEFEEGLRRDMTSTQLNNGLSSSVFVTKNEVDNVLRLRKQQRRFGYLILPHSDYQHGIEVSEKEITDYYNDNQSLYAVPEQVSVSYIELQASDLAKAETVADSTLRQLYNEQLDELTVDEERRASHILVSIDGTDDAAVAKAKARAEDLLKQIRAGADFAELAKKYSADPGSAEQGGDLGYFGRGVMVPSFEKVAFAMKKGEISEPVRTPYGFHIIKLTGIHAGKTRSFESMRDDLRKQYLEHQAEDAFYDTADRLTNLVYEHPDTLENAAQELDLKIRTSPLFTQSDGTGVAADPRVREAAFSADVLEGGNNSDVIMLGDNHLVVLRIKEHKPVSHRPIVEVRDKIIQQLQEQKAAASAEKTGQDLVEKAKQGEEPVDLADRVHGEWKETGFIGRNDSSLSREILDEAFAMARPGEGKTMWQGVRLASGDYVVIGLHDVRDGDPADAVDDERQQIRKEIISRQAQELRRWILQSQKDRARIRETQDGNG